MENELSTMNRRGLSTQNTQALNDNKNKVNCWISSEFSIPWLSGAIIGKTSVKWSYCNFIVFQIGTSSTLRIQLWEDQDKVFYWLQMLLKFNQRLLEDCLKSVRMSAHVGAKNLKLLADHHLAEILSWWPTENPPDVEIMDTFLKWETHNLQLAAGFTHHWGSPDQEMVRHQVVRRSWCLDKSFSSFNNTMNYNI